MKKIRRVLLLFVIVAYAGMVCACKGNVEEKEGKTSIEELKTTPTDVEATESETISGDKESEKESQSKEEITTVVDTKNQETSASKEEVTTSKKEDTTTKKETTTKKQQQTTTKKQQQTTTKKQQQTTTKKQQQQTTTKKPQETTTKKQQTGSSEEATTVTHYTSNSAATGNTRGGAIAVTEFKESDAAKAKAKAIVGQIIKSNMSDYECVKAIHDYLVKNVNYDSKSIADGSINDNEGHPSHTAEGALCKNLAVCDGYAKAFELLCAESGIYAYMMYGDGINPDGQKESHAWNVVKVNGEWYQVDCTWDDPVINGSVVTDGSNLTYTYFLLTDTEMYKDHVLDASYSTNAKKCTSTLFKGLGQKLAIEAQMKYTGCTVANVDSFYIMNKNYTSKGQFSYSLAIPVAESNKINGDKLQNAIVDGVRASGFTGGFSYNYTSIQVGNYCEYSRRMTKVSKNE